MGESRERGVAVLEAAAWLAVLLPVAVLGASLCLQLYNQRTVAVIPEAVLREARSPVLRWGSDGDQGAFSIAHSEMRETAAALAARALEEARTSLVSVKDLSVRACCWTLTIDQRSGAANGVEAQECVSNGTIPTSPVLDAALSRASKTRLGVPLAVAEGHEPEFVSRALVFGVALGARFVGPGTATTITQAHISYPRQEISL